MVDALQNTYSNVQDVSNQEMISAIRAAIVRENKLPLTLIVLDEVQQFIGTSGDRAIEVQEMVEAIVKDESLGGKLTFVGTGQTTVTGTPTLAKLQGRFTIRIELSDTDVDAVVRQVILAKNSESKPNIEAMMQENIGEISRHLAHASPAHASQERLVRRDP